MHWCCTTAHKQNRQNNLLLLSGTYFYISLHTLHPPSLNGGVRLWCEWLIFIYKYVQSPPPTKKNHHSLLPEYLHFILLHLQEKSTTSMTAIRWRKKYSREIWCVFGRTTPYDPHTYINEYIIYSYFGCTYLLFVRVADSPVVNLLLGWWCAVRFAAVGNDDRRVVGKIVCATRFFFTTHTHTHRETDTHTHSDLNKKWLIHTAADVFLFFPGQQKCTNLKRGIFD